MPRYRATCPNHRLIGTSLFFNLGNQLFPFPFPLSVLSCGHSVNLLRFCRVTKMNWLKVKKVPEPGCVLSIASSAQTFEQHPPKISEKISRASGTLAWATEAVRSVMTPVARLVVVEDDVERQRSYMPNDNRAGNMRRVLDLTLLHIPHLTILLFLPIYPATALLLAITLSSSSSSTLDTNRS